MELHTISETTLLMIFSFKATAFCVPSFEVISTFKVKTFVDKITKILDIPGVSLYMHSIQNCQLYLWPSICLTTIGVKAGG